LNLADQRKKLVAVSDVERAISELVLTTKARMQVIPPRLADELVGVTSRVMRQALIEKAVNEALLQLSKGLIPESSPTSINTNKSALLEEN